MKKALKRLFASLLMLFIVISCFVPILSDEPSDDVELEYIELSGDVKKSSEGVYAIGLYVDDLNRLVGDKFDDIYGGCWLDDDYIPHVSLTALEPEYSNIARKFGVVVSKCDYSYKELVSLSTQTWEANEEKFSNHLQSVGIDEKENRVFVTVFKLEELETKSKPSTNELKNNGRFIVKSVESESESRFVVALVGGNKITINRSDGVATCSVGFAAKSGTNTGFVTAGHCSKSTSDSVKFGSTTVGTVKKRQLSGKVDASWVQLSSGNTIAKKDFKGIPYTAIASSSSYGVTQGATVDLFGLDNKTYSAKITNTSYNEVVQGVSLSDFIKVDVGNLPDGMSGGLVRAGYQSSSAGGAYSAVGVISATNTTYSMICKSTNILTTFSLTNP